VPESHLIPLTLQVALGKREYISIFGTDYPTPDGTCVRDYIHVSDLPVRTFWVLDALRPARQANSTISAPAAANSVREVLEAVRRVTGI